MFRYIKISIQTLATVLLIGTVACSSTELVPQPNNYPPDLEATIEAKVSQIVSQMPTITPVPLPTPYPESPDNSSMSITPAKPIPSNRPQAEDPLTLVEAQENILTEIYNELLPSIVEIRTRGVSGEGRLQGGGGSGFVWDEDTNIVTNHHVVNGAEELIVVFANGEQFEAGIIGSDPDSDLAVLGLINNNVMPTPPNTPLGDSSEVKPGQMAIAIGSPFGQDFTITSGIISAIGRTIKSGNSQFSIPRVIQTDAPINPGNSGGPLLNKNGEVIGVNTQIISGSGSSSGIGFAVPINTAKRVIPELITNGVYHYAWLGIRGTNMTPAIAKEFKLPRGTKGTLVLDVGGPAELAGILGSELIQDPSGQESIIGGDIIIGIDDVTITSIEDLLTYLADHKRPGDTSLVHVLRSDYSRKTLKVTLQKRPAP